MEKNSNGTWTDYIFAGGKRIVQLNGTAPPKYYWTDLLGTSRLMTSNVGVSLGEDIHAPFGQLVVDVLPTYYIFTGKRV